MKKLPVILSLCMIFSATAAAQSSQASGPPGLDLMPGDFFYPVESFVEDVEVAVAGLVGGPDFKAKAIANNANESLSEARQLADNNQSERAAQLIDKYSENLNRSQKLAEESGDNELSEKLDNISGRNVKVLEEVKERVPEQAQKGIEKAINRSGKAGERPGKIPGSEKIPGKGDPRPGEAGENRSSPQNLTENSEKLKNRTEDLLENSTDKLQDQRPSDNRSSSGGSADNSEDSGGKVSPPEKNGDENPLGGTGKDLL